MANPVPNPVQIPAAQSRPADGLTQSQKPTKEKKQKAATGSEHPLEVRRVSSKINKHVFTVIGSFNLLLISSIIESRCSTN